MVVLGAIALGSIVFAVASCGGSASNPSAPTSALVATRLIQKGTPGNVIVRKGYYRLMKFQKNALMSGALADPSALNGKLTLRDIYPGQQLTADLFGAANT